MRKSHRVLKSLRLHAWRLSGNSLKRQSLFKEVVKAASSDLRDPQHASTKSGPGSYIGVVEGILAPAKPLSSSWQIFFCTFEGSWKCMFQWLKAIGLPLIMSLFFLASDRVISQMFSSFEKSCLLKKVKPPKWNLSLVLRSLTLLPYEPLKLSMDRPEKLPPPP